jgi:aspartyl-tRNA(Asn)/glutamyl-tRNA(Gln) amidotransferase subunit B
VDEDALGEAVAKAVADNPSQAAAYRGGKAATFGWFVGQVMKATGGKAAPAVVNRLLKEELEKRT